MKVRELDAKIIKILLRDGRKSFSEIAKECSTTRNQCWKRFKLLEKKGIITGATVQINYDKLGYDAVVNLLISVEAQQIEQVMEYIGKITEVGAYRQYNSTYNLRAVASLKNLNELDQVKTAIRYHLPTIALRTYIWTEVKNIPENLQLIATPVKIKELTEQNEQAKNMHSEKIKIDDQNLKIIEKLAENGRTPFNKIAKEIDTSIDTVLKRYQKLVKENIIRVSIQIDPNKIGYRSILDFNLSFASQVDPAKIIQMLTKIPDIIIITKTSGDYDLQITAMIKDIDQMFALQEKIARITGITKIETSARKIPTKWPTAKQYISTF